MKIISVSNQKGGVGKTSTATNLAYCVASLGHRTLLIDLDPQANSTLIYDKDMNVKPFINKMFDKYNFGINELKIDTQFDNLWLIPSSIKLALAAENAATKLHREKILHNKLKLVKEDFDYIIIDCPPNLGILSINAIFAADHILIPVNYSRYAMEGLKDLIGIIAEAKESLDVPVFSIKGWDFSILKNCYDQRTKVTNEVIETDLHDYFIKDKVLKTTIRKVESINQAQLSEDSVFEYDPKSSACVDYLCLTEELLRRLNHGQEKDSI